MNEESFWDLINSSEGLAEKRIAYIAARLATVSLEDVCAFNFLQDRQMNRAHTALLWGAAYLILDGCSDDHFDYFKSWLILQGKELFDATVRDPDTLADLEFDDNYYPSCEEFLYVAGRVYRERTGSELPDMPYEPRPELDLWDFDSSNEMSTRLPKLWRRYGTG